ncbi:uncharacterized protein N7529_004313 [Penicillium soppii]|uniref:uncharacterized protein n=1 Tax=Penicillium soppii TaxID=69789 RepID=UPI0025466FA1|nr:uncharacterized protein N7529_004313 [Penicillium soppii]KAJ5871960.1 hypothetical protein N7529_004313 [Penicillium soppii]
MADPSNDLPDTLNYLEGLSVDPESENIKPKEALGVVRYVGRFEILEKIGKIAYKLDIPEHWLKKGMYPVISIAHLEPAPTGEDPWQRGGEPQEHVPTFDGRFPDDANRTPKGERFKETNNMVLRQVSGAIRGGGQMALRLALTSKPYQLSHLSSFSTLSSNFVYHLFNPDIQPTSSIQNQNLVYPQKLVKKVKSKPELKPELIQDTRDEDAGKPARDPSCRKENTAFTASLQMQLDKAKGPVPAPATTWQTGDPVSTSKTSSNACITKVLDAFDATLRLRLTAK